MASLKVKSIKFYPMFSLGSQGFGITVVIFCFWLPPPPPPLPPPKHIHAMSTINELNLLNLISRKFI